MEEAKQTEKIKKTKRRLEGLVVSDRMQKTVVVMVNRIKEHPKYKKRHKVSKRYKAHDENNEFKVGGKVVIEETRPLSRWKRWRVVPAKLTQNKTQNRS